MSVCSNYSKFVLLLKSYAGQKAVKIKKNTLIIGFSMNQITRLAGMLLIISSVTHVLQLKVYPLEHHVIGAAAFGIIYFFIGFFLLRHNRLAFWLGAIMPSIGGVLGVYRFLFLHPNPFTVFHVLIDLVVVPICIYNLNKKRSVDRIKEKK